MKIKPKMFANMAMLILAMSLAVVTPVFASGDGVSGGHSDEVETAAPRNPAQVPLEAPQTEPSAEIENQVEHNAETENQIEHSTEIENQVEHGAEVQIDGTEPQDAVDNGQVETGHDVGVQHGTENDVDMNGNSNVNTDDNRGSDSHRDILEGMRDVISNLISTLGRIFGM